MSRRPAAVALLPREPGVYRFRDASGGVLYLGRALDLRRRVASYWGDLGDRAHLARMVAGIARLEALVCASEHEAAWAERNLLERHLPPWNLSRGGEESPVHIRLDTSPGSPGLGTAYRVLSAPGVRHFGPYLGGRKVRLAVSALLRVFPLGYTGTGLTGTGHDFARLRGIGAADLDGLTASVTAVLERDPATVVAVLEELTKRRRAASENLRFELAGRLHEEIRAVEWIVAPQRMTVLDGGDADLRGWANGTLVRFEVRGGRLHAWEQRPCSRTGTGVGGPRSWSAFARRNADLAAALAAAQP